MKKFILIGLLFISYIGSSQIRVPQSESFILRGAIDPTASIKERGLNTNLEVEYQGHLYVKFGIESFIGLEPNYFDWHGSVGFNLVTNQYENIRLYGGLRLGRIYRGNGTKGELIGFEGGIDVYLNKFNKGLFVGLRATYDHRNDVKGLGGNPFWRESGYITLGYKF